MNARWCEGDRTAGGSIDLHGNGRDEKNPEDEERLGACVCGRRWQGSRVTGGGGSRWLGAGNGGKRCGAE